MDLSDATVAVLTTEELIGCLRDRIEVRYEHSRERSLALTKLEEAELWLTKAAPLTGS